MMNTAKLKRFNLTEFSLNNPHLIISIYLALIILAIIAVIDYIPKRLMPYVESPIIGIVTMQPGLSAREMEIYVSKPIEEKMVDIKNVRYIRSTSQDGFSMVTLEFPYGNDMKQAQVEIEALMKVVQADLPVTGANLKPSWVLSIDPLNLPVISFNLTSPTVDEVKLRQLADNEITNRLKKIPDVWSVYAFGGYKRQLQVIIDRQQLAAYKLSILDIKNAIDKFNIAKPAGRLTTSDEEAIIRIDNLCLKPSDILNYPLKAVNNKVIYLKDIARVQDTYLEKRSSYNHIHNKKIEQGIEISIIQTPKASSPKVIKAVLKEINAIKKEYPSLNFTISYSNSRFVDILMKNISEELILAVVLTSITIFLFLGDINGTLIALITLPVSLSIAVLALIPLNLSLDSSTLIGLLLSIGRLVDDSIIDIHAIKKHLKLGKSPKLATIDGISEVRLSVLASTMVLIVALVPLVICGGIVQQMFIGLVIPIMAGLISSFLVSLTLTAVLAEKLLGRQENKFNLWLNRIHKPFDAFLSKLENKYKLLVKFILKHKFANLCRVIVTIIIGFTFYNFIDSEMMPLADVGQAYGVLEVNPNLSFKKTYEIVNKVEKIIAQFSEIKDVSAEIGYDPGGTYFNGYNMPNYNFATFMITLSDKDERKKSIWDITDAIVAKATSTISGIRRFQIKEMGSDVMASSQAPISILITGSDEKILDGLSKKVENIARNTFGMHQVARDWSLCKKEWVIKPNLKLALNLGLTPSDIANQSYYAINGALTDEFYHIPNIRQATINIRYDENFRRNVNDLNLMTITAQKGYQVPLNSIADIVQQTGPNLINHDSLRKAITVMGYYRKNEPASMDLSMDILMQSISQIKWPKGYSIEMRGDMTQMMDSFNRLLNGLGLAVIFIFLILVAQFRGFLQPLQMLISFPLELSGVFIALWLMHQAFSTVSVMAVIILTGMDMTTAILLIDEILRVRRQNIDRDQAIAIACPMRLRPILMTTIITIIVMLPLSIFPKTGMDAYSPLGTVIIGGLTMGTVLSLIDIPIMHAYVDDLINWLNSFKSGVK